MKNKEFVLERINIYTNSELDPNNDKNVEQVLRNKFNIHLPQRPTLNESLTSTTSDHEIIQLILQYRAMD